MQIWMNIVLVLQLLAAIAMIGLVLVQHGADMGASFGSGASGSLFGATGSANFLSRSTAVCAGVFFVCTLALAFLANGRGQAGVPAAEGSVLDKAPVAASAPALVASAAVGAIPVQQGAATVPAPVASAAKP
ncbi:MAG: hypothetical protein RL223_1119 [Pseudomonadota bacterium]